jgi:hypothetical protein|tara:strand:+ start:187 stop:408 length:222 start_codon:yes stop_codon:yes gene_type:complete
LDFFLYRQHHLRREAVFGVDGGERFGEMGEERGGDDEGTFTDDDETIFEKNDDDATTDDDDDFGRERSRAFVE